MSFAKRLEQISSGLFFIGFVVSKLEHFPITVIKGLFNLVALGLYLLGYLSWILAGYISPDHPQRRDRWYGFIQFKEQYQFAAIIGSIATVLFIAAMFVPVINVPALWVFVISNGVWFTAEYHKLKHPPAYDKNFSTIKQTNYLRFASLVTLISVAGAISGTIAFACPPLAVTIFTVTTLVSIVLGAAALMYWLEANFPTEPADEIDEPVNSTSYQQISSLTMRKKPPTNDHLLLPDIEIIPEPAKSRETLPATLKQPSKSAQIDEDSSDQAIGCRFF